MKSEENNQLHAKVEQQAKRLHQAERDRSTLLAQTVYLGTLGLVLVLPVIAGAYLGLWLDSLLAGYSMRWTLSLIFLGLVVGGINVWLMIRD
jgi:ATP synthase protein I